MFGTLVGSVMGSIITNIFSPNDLYRYGWRIPFLASFILGIVGLYLRINIPESEAFKKTKQISLKTNPIFVVLFNEKYKILLITGIFCINLVAFYSFFVYLPVSLVKNGILNERTSLVINSISLIVMSIMILVVGFLSDKYGGYIFMKIASIGFILFTCPLLFLINSGNYLWIMLSQNIIAIFNAMFLAPTPYIYTSLFPNNIRFSGIAISMNISAVIFGGLTPLIMTFLEKTNHHILFQS